MANKKRTVASDNVEFLENPDEVKENIDRIKCKKRIPWINYIDYTVKAIDRSLPGKIKSIKRKTKPYLKTDRGTEVKIKINKIGSKNFIKNGQSFNIKRKRKRRSANCSDFYIKFEGLTHAYVERNGCSFIVEKVNPGYSQRQKLKMINPPNIGSGYDDIIDDLKEKTLYRTDHYRYGWVVEEAPCSSTNFSSKLITEEL